MKNFFCADIKAVFAAGIMFTLIFSAAAAQGANAGPENRTVVAFGSSQDTSDASDSRNKAVSSAMRSAVHSAATGLLSEETIRENFETLTEILDEKSDDFIRDYRILEEAGVKDNHQVLIRATVSHDRIRQALKEEGIETAPPELPSILFMIAEKNLDDLDFDYWWRSGYRGFSNPAATPSIRQIFLENDFTVIDPPADRTSSAKMLKNLEPGAEPADYEASIVARRLGAELVVTGTATAEATANRMGEDIRTFRAGVNLRVIDAETGEKLTTIREQAITVSRDAEKAGRNAMADAAFQAGRKLSDRIASIRLQDSEAAEQLIIRVTGDPVLEHLEKLRNAIKQQSGVSGLHTTDMTARSASLAVDYRGTAQELADDLLTHSFDSFGINIKDISEEELSVELILQ
ncbi:MAG: hypothetical protein ACQETG_01930 [Thermodesulfobacteriota bacterium]